MRRRTTLTCRSIVSRPDVQEIKLHSDDGEFRQDRARRITRRSLDHLVCSLQYRLRDRDPDLLRGFEVDDQLELSCLLDGQITWLRTSEDLVHVGGGPPEALAKIGPVRHQATGLRILPE